MRRLRTAALGLFLGAALVGACSSSTDSGDPSSDPLELVPALNSPNFPIATLMTLDVDGDRHQVQVDTGSIYLFVGNANNDTKLECSDPASFHYGGNAFVDFCATTAPVQALTIDGELVEFSSDLTYGQSVFHDFNPPNAIIGMSANLEGTNIGGLEPVIDQLAPEYLSFQFPNGPLNNGWAQFAPLPDDALRGVPGIPLVSPGGLEYGYTAEISRVDFIADQTVRATIKSDDDGVYLERNGARTRIAETNLAFFDTGATPPYVPISGDISLLSDQVTEIMFADDEKFDTIQFTFDVGDDDHVVVSSNTIGAYGSSLTWDVLPTASDFPAGLRQLTTVVGLGTLSNYDFQFTYEDGRATTVHLVDR